MKTNTAVVGDKMKIIINEFMSASSKFLDAIRIYDNIVRLDCWGE